MTRPLADVALDFITELRGAGVRISIAESLDAMRAIGVVGLARAPLREALRAALIKDEADNPLFDDLFGRYFAGYSGSPVAARQSRSARIGVSGAGVGRGGGAATTPSRDPAASVASPRWAAQNATAPHTGEAKPNTSKSDPANPGGEPAETSRAERNTAEAHQGGTGERGLIEPRRSDHGGAAGTAARIDQLPFARYSQLEYERARETLAILQRRLRLRLSRRMRLARAGRIDLRRTLHAAVQHGGALIEPRFRARRPKHLDLLMLVDISGSVHYACTLMLELMAGARRCFRRMHGFVFIDRLAAADFEHGHLVMTPALDLHARSDFGKVCGELLTTHAALLTRTTVLVIMGDGRNNRRSPRTDLLRAAVRRCQATFWLNPEPFERWNTGDSVITAYSRMIDRLLPSANLRGLESALARII